LLLAVLPEGLPLTVSIAGYKIAVLTQRSSSAGFRAAHQKDITIEDIYTFYFLNGFSILVYSSYFHIIPIFISRFQMKPGRSSSNISVK